METFLFLLLIIGGEALFSWLKQNKQKPKSPTYSETEEKSSVEEMEAPSSPAEHLRELLRRYAEDHPEEIETSTSEPYLPDDEFFETEEPVASEMLEDIPAEPVVKEESIFAKYQGKAFERRVEKEEDSSFDVVPSRQNKNLKPCFSLNAARAGFVWSKILEEPRFKRRWNPMNR
ncbi:MAG: hypothetical protein J6A06_05900 [Fibrobacteraceae bacterium]|nr:hypothetical protein [Fibrobacteraceae bacterium]